MGKKVKKAHGEIVNCQKGYEKKPTSVKNFGIWLRYDSRSGTHNMYREYRDLTAAGAEKVSPPGRQAVPRFQDQVSAPEEGQVHGQTSPEIHYRQTVHPRPLRRKEHPDVAGCCVSGDRNYTMRRSEKLWWPKFVSRILQSWFLF